MAPPVVGRSGRVICMSQAWTRRTFLGRTGAAGTAALLSLPTSRAASAAEELRIALVAPLSGRWARQGQLKKMGADMAIEEINGQGGVKALGGAKVVLR